MSRALDGDNPNPAPKKAEEEDEYETPRTVTQHCDYGECDAVISDYGGRKEVDCPRGTNCRKYTWCPFTFDE
jgi:hypothetical protein